MGSEMCIRDRDVAAVVEADRARRTHVLVAVDGAHEERALVRDAACLLYTSDAADERSSVDLGGRRIIKKKNCVSAVGMR